MILMAEAVYKDPEVARIMERFHRAKKKRQQERDAKWKELDAYDRNQQWDLKGVPDWLPKPVTNYIHIVKYTKRASLAVDNPTAKLRATHPNYADLVRDLQKAYIYIWDKIKARAVVRDAIGTAKLLGDAFVQVFWNEHKEGRMGVTVLGGRENYHEGEIDIRELDPALVYPDPTAFNISDCQFIHIVERKPLEWVKNHPHFKEKASGLKAIENDAPEERGEIYLRDYNVENDGIIDFHTHYEKKPNDEGGFTYSVTYLAGNKILHHIPQLKPNRYPIARLSDFKQRQSFWSMSTCEFILDNQRIINKVESIIVMIGTLMQNPQKVVSKNSGISIDEVSQFGNLQGVVWQSNDPDPSKSIVHLNPPQIPTVLFNLLEQAKENIREITGITQAYLGQNVGSLQTSSGVNQLIERATLRDRDQMYDLEMFITDLTEIIIDFMLEYYTEERWLRIGEGDSEEDFLRFVARDFKDIDYDIQIDVSAKAPITRMREADEARQLLEMQGQYGGQFPTSIITPQEAIRKMHITNAEEIIERMNMEEMVNKTEQAMQVAQMMNEALNAGVEPDEVMQMGMAMFEQMEAEMKGVGSRAPISE